MAVLIMILALTCGQRRHLRRNKLFRDRPHPLDQYDDIEMNNKFRFRREDTREGTYSRTAQDCPLPRLAAWPEETPPLREKLYGDHVVLRKTASFTCEPLAWTS